MLLNILDEASFNDSIPKTEKEKASLDCAKRKNSKPKQVEPKQMMARNK